MENDFLVTTLRCAGLVNPSGIDNRKPLLSWQMQSGRRGARQTAYRVIVDKCPSRIRTGTGQIWDSGEICSSQSINIEYAGKPLQSGTKYYWAAGVRDEKGVFTWSPVNEWSMGLLNKKAWQADWIGYEKGVAASEAKELRPLPARYLRRNFSSDSGIKRATTYICGLGYYELYINGSRIGDHVLDPVLMQYDKHIPYVSYDVTTSLREGDNAIGVILGNGRYFAPRINVPTYTMHFGSPRLLFQMNVEYFDGSTQTICSDKFWKVTDHGPIRENNDYDGEIYDARMELGNWSTVNYDCKDWHKAQLVDAPKGKLRAQMMEPHRIISRLKPVAINNPQAGVWVFDFGQNLVGWCQLRASGRSGQKISLRFAESVTPDGMVYMANMRSAKSRDEYIMKGDGQEIYAPRFTYHGFQFAELRGFDGVPDETTLTAEVVHSAVDYAGDFECDDTTVNNLIKNMRWGIQGNYRSIPTDCPQRDERHGWTGDRVIVSKGESFLFDIDSLYSKWFNDIRDAQKKNGCLSHVAPAFWPRYEVNVTWPSVYIMGTRTMYEQYGNTENIRIHYPRMKKWLAFLSQYIQDGLIDKDCYGDWCVPPANLTEIHSSDDSRFTAPTYLASAYYYRNLQIMAEFAGMLGKNEDAADFTGRARVIRSAIVGKYRDSSSGEFAGGTQTASLIALVFNLYDSPAEREKLAASLADNILNKTNGHTGTGLIGCQWLMLGLDSIGRNDIAWKLATQQSYPGWGYMLSQGATTIWELWNGNTADPAMNSRNHVMMIGDFITWAFERLGGIKADSANPGFKNINMQPDFYAGPAFVKCSHKSPYGTIASLWTNNNGVVQWNVEIPANSNATLAIPASTGSITESGRKLAGEFAVQETGGGTTIQLPSGKYEFRFESNRV